MTGQQHLCGCPLTSILSGGTRRIQAWCASPPRAHLHLLHPSLPAPLRHVWAPRTAAAAAPLQLPMLQAAPHAALGGRRSPYCRVVCADTPAPACRSMAAMWFAVELCRHLRKQTTFTICYYFAPLSSTFSKPDAHVVQLLLVVQPVAWMCRCSNAQRLARIVLSPRGTSNDQCCFSCRITDQCGKSCG